MKLQKQYMFTNLFSKGEFELPVGSVIQVEEVVVKPGYEIYRHMQQCDEITHVISGKAKTYCDGECVKIDVGDIHIVRNGVEHSIIADSEKELRFICIGVILNEDYTENEEFIKLIKSMKNFVIKDNGDIRILSELLLNEFYTADNMTNPIINRYLSQIYALICRGYRQTSAQMSQLSRFGMRSDYVMYNILRYIDREYTNIKSVQEIATKFSYNENYLSHLFKNKMGISVKQYINQKKIQVAENYLTTTDLNIEHIATQLNFNTAHSFYQAFKRHHGMSPMQYRNKHAEGKQKN